VNISDVEYGKLVSRLEFHDTMRNNLLTFSFTAVLAIKSPISAELVTLHLPLPVMSIFFPS